MYEVVGYASEQDSKNNNSSIVKEFNNVKEAVSYARTNMSRDKYHVILLIDDAGKKIFAIKENREYLFFDGDGASFDPLCNMTYSLFVTMSNLYGVSEDGRYMIGDEKDSIYIKDIDKGNYIVKDVFSEGCSEVIQFLVTNIINFMSNSLKAPVKRYIFTLDNDINCFYSRKSADEKGSIDLFLDWFY